jgi:catechol 2,3-dioxygenase-like lactoylglutathione lyase family enzyme
MSSEAGQGGPGRATIALQPGTMHRLGLAVRDSAQAVQWYGHMFGAKPFGKSFMPFATDDPSLSAEVREQEGADSTLMWHGGFPLLFLAPLGDEGVVGRHLQRWGTGVHSLAWEIDDMWGVDSRLRHRGMRITGISIPGRHFFVHPRDTDGVMIEFTDTYWLDDPRRGAVPISESGGVVEGSSVAWVTAVVADASATAQLFAELTGAVEVVGNVRPSASGEEVVDFRVGDLPIRFLTPTSDRSRYWDPLQVGPRLYSYALRVPDLDVALTALGTEGVRPIARDEGMAWMDPAGCLGIPIELTV